MSYNTSVSPFVRLYIATTTDTGNTFQRYVAGNVFPAYAKLPFYTISADPVNNGYAILGWCDTRYGDLDVLLSKSIDGGQTWAIPVRINDDAVNNGIVQDQVWSAFSATGELALNWRDRRMNDTTSTSPFDIYAAVSLDGGNSFQPNFRMSSVSSPFQALSCCNSFIGLALTDSFVVANWGDNRNLDWDIYFNKANIAITDVEEINSDIPVTFVLYQNYPNPFNPTTVIGYQLPVTGNVTLKIYDVLGREITTLVNETKEAGSYEVKFDAKQLSSGVYFYQLKTSSSVITKKLMVMQ
ncbi:MAG: T9SS type A sorting domain-containing protein [Bacteroidetes bacterium]|nr:T9SS type A sorting domain-containing protein [Bacteroidota bacterium]MBU2508210.1 T9SS type A sorting domain-containing protein [Bacteroidota bacterium]